MEDSDVGEIEKRSPRWNPELIVAVFAVVIGVATMFVYIYQARIMGRQMRATSWPYLETIFSNTSDSFSITVKNKGTGPAIVKNAVIRLDDKSFPDTQKNIDSVLYMLTGSRKILSSYTNVNNRVISPGEAVSFAEVNDSTNVKLFLDSIQEHSVHLVVCYCSVFDECWTMVGNKVEPCEDCKMVE